MTLLEQELATDPYQLMGLLAAEHGSGGFKLRFAADCQWYSHVDPMVARDAGNQVEDTTGDGAKQTCLVSRPDSRAARASASTAIAKLAPGFH